ncbi:hypothetical protein CK228_13540 [Mesorhizobium sp. WSM4312]|uniref:hypothetical protein n=1 Tax=Mesorhizobium sp. WSM4312 TaxID=2029411 RepID=UPI000BAF3797|nr:hypothetical protein [Mesorhizobium sp. WSM4312]PBB68128.1 hypothetical protein CK228_13540 [Mesorhizobium sp. WSM4312]
MKVQYLEIRPCVEHDGATHSFRGEPNPTYEFFTPEGAEEAAEAFRAAQNGEAGPVFWTIYGIDTEGLAQAIGDFVSQDAAFETLYAILGVMVDARDILEASRVRIADDDDHGERISNASAVLEDFINQCSNSERI